MQIYTVKLQKDRRSVLISEMSRFQQLKICYCLLRCPYRLSWLDGAYCAATIEERAPNCFRQSCQGNITTIASMRVHVYIIRTWFSLFPLHSTILGWLPSLLTVSTTSSYTLARKSCTIIHVYYIQDNKIPRDWSKAWTSSIDFSTTSHPI